MSNHFGRGDSASSDLQAGDPRVDGRKHRARTLSVFEGLHPSIEEYKQLARPAVNRNDPKMVRFRIRLTVPPRARDRARCRARCRFVAAREEGVRNIDERDFFRRNEAAHRGGGGGEAMR